jgi:uncharacterized membrane protein
VGEFLLFIHILAVTAWLGANVTQFVVTPAMQKTGGAPAAEWMRQVVRLGTRVYTPAAVLILVTGVWMVLRDSLFEFEQVFVTVGFITVIVGMALGMRVFGPGRRDVAALHDAGDETAAAVAHRRLAVFGIVDTALVVITIWMMVDKTGL